MANEREAERALSRVCQLPNLDDITTLVRDYYKPEEVYDEDVLDTWALANGYVKAE